MAFDKELVAAKLRRWEKYLREYRLPEWDRLPDLGLYMEQVTVLMRQYLDYLPPELKEEQFITASTMLLGVRRGTAAVAVWLALGALGVPVFAGFNGGIAYMLGSTGGYLWGFLLWTPMEGFLFRLGKGKLPLLILGMAAGLALCYTFGTVWFMVVYARTTGPVALSTVLGWCVLPYLVPDAVKLAMAVPLILKGRKHVRS